MSALKRSIVAALGFASVIAASSSVANADAHWTEPRIPGASEQALVLGRDLDGDGDPDEITIRLEVIEVTEEVYPGEFVNSGCLPLMCGTPSQTPIYQRKRT